MSEKCSQADLRKLLFAQLERLNNDALSGEKLKEEVTRTAAFKTLADSLIEDAQTHLKAAQFVADTLGEVRTPAMLELPAPKPREPLALVK